MGTTLWCGRKAVDIDDIVGPPILAGEQPAAPSMNEPDIPAIDMSALWSHDAAARRRVAHEIGQCCTAIGFLAVSGHGIPRHVTETAVDATRRFFAQDTATKLTCVRPSGIYRGYSPVMPFGQQRDPRVPQPLYEAFFAGDENLANSAGARAGSALCAANIWPDTPTGFKGAIIAYFEHVMAVTHRLLGAFAMALDLEEDAFTRSFHRHLSNISLHHYPARPEAMGLPPDDVLPHRDSNMITVLLPGEVGGLQVRSPDGSWLDIPHREGRLVVNIGDELEILSGGRFASTLHRIHPPRNRARYSIGLFAVPDEDAVVAPWPGLEIHGAPDRMAPRRAGEDLAAFIAGFDRFVDKLPASR